MSCSSPTSSSANFIRHIVEQDVASGEHSSIVTRFPPEPNGFLHLGHAKSICLNFGLAKDFGGICHLRFDDTNPCKEEARYIESIKADVQWLGFHWGEGNLFYTSDYFQQLYDYAVTLIRKELAYIDHQSAELIKRTRGTLTSPGTNSPYRDSRGVEENLRLFEQMRRGEFSEGECVLRAKIDMGDGNMNMRDPVIYRILNQPHPRTGRDWCIYPMYDFAHGQSDSIERITHSICTLEFELHRPLYEWLQRNIGIYRTRQIEFARLNLTYMVMSKRKLLTLVQEGFVADWDDPRMPTLSGMRRRGYPARALREFCERIGVAKRENVIQIELLEKGVREELNKSCHRRYGIVKPVKLIIKNYPEDLVEMFDVPNHPEQPDLGMRQIPFCRELWIDRDDVSSCPQPGFHRLALGREVRLRYGYWITCTAVDQSGDGQVQQVECTYDPSTRGGGTPSDGRKVKGTIHWLSARHAHSVEFRMYGRLFTVPRPEQATDAGPDNSAAAVVHHQAEDGREVEEEEEEGSSPGGWRDFINPESLQSRHGYIEKLAFEEVTEATRADPPRYPQFQLERVGYFTADHTAQGGVVLNLTVDLNEGGGGGSEVDSKQAARDLRQRAIEEKKMKKQQQQQMDVSRKQKKKADQENGEKV
eukprot:GHVS01009421.1.p1 GENE.GHVS01009421.1~~GHVS01009421.1.p1  ORF type:complete len:646 (+),score=89.72 GHVS01009421.1:338-2275(+)